jgi:hypothetical protein
MATRMIKFFLIGLDIAVNQDRLQEKSVMCHAIRKFL